MTGALALAKKVARLSNSDLIRALTAGTLYENRQGIYDTASGQIRAGGRAVKRVAKRTAKSVWKASKKSRSAVTANGSRVSSTLGARGPSYKKRSRKVLKKRSKRVKVSREFKKKVNVALEGTHYKGQFTRHSHRSLYQSNAVNKIQWCTGQATAALKYYTASPLQIIDAASVLWFKKAQSNNWATLTGNMNVASMKIRVRDCTSEYTMVNNKERQMTYFVYEMMCNQDTNDDPIDDWNALLTTDYYDPTDPRPNIGLEHVTNAIDDTTLAVQLSNMYNTNTGPLPEFFSEWRKKWKFKKSKFILEPGEKFTYTVSTGPFIFDPLRAYGPDSTVSWKMKKGMTKSVMFSYHPEVTFALDGHYGMDNDKPSFVAAAPITQGSLHDHLLVKNLYKLEMPESVQGLDPVVAGDPVISSNRHNAYAWFYQYDMTARDPATEIQPDEHMDESNPA